MASNAPKCDHRSASLLDDQQILNVKLQLFLLFDPATAFYARLQTTAFI